MIQRRDILKLAAALGAAPAVAKIAPAEAARLLAGPADQALPALGVGALHDPATFAAEVDGFLPDDVQSALFGCAAPAVYAEYLAARAALLRELPILESVRFDHPYHKLDEAAHAMLTCGYLHGIRVGAAYEHLRLAMLNGQES